MRTSTDTPKLFRLDEKHPGLSAVFEAARSRYASSPDETERMVERVRHAAVSAEPLHADPAGLDTYEAGSRWMARAGIIGGAISFGAGVLVTVGVGIGVRYMTNVHAPATGVEAASAGTEPSRVALSEHRGTMPIRASTTGTPSENLEFPAMEESTVPGAPTLPATSLRSASPNKRTTARKERSVSHERSLGSSDSEPVATQEMNAPSKAYSSVHMPSGAQDTTALIPLKTIPCSIRERETIGEARAVLRRSSALTLSILNEFERQCRFAAFEPEALQLRMKAYANLGKTGNAIETAKRLWKEFPNTPPGSDACNFLENMSH